MKALARISRSLPYPCQRTLQVTGLNVGSSPWRFRRFPAACPFGVLHIDSSPGSVSGTCFADTICPWPDPFPLPAPQTATHRDPCSRASSVLWACPTSHVRASPPCSLGIHGADLAAILRGQTWDLPVPVRRVSVHAWGLRPRGVRTHLAITMRQVVPSAHGNNVGTPIECHFRGSMSCLHVPLLTLHPYPCGHACIARGRCRFATASPYGSLIRCSPAATGASPV